jgi:hypothetical protein
MVSSAQILKPFPGQMARLVTFRLELRQTQPGDAAAHCLVVALMPADHLFNDGRLRLALVKQFKHQLPGF